MLHEGGGSPNTGFRGLGALVFRGLGYRLLGVIGPLLKICCRGIVPLKKIEYSRVYADLSIVYPKPYSIYFRGTISRKGLACGFS